MPTKNQVVNYQPDGTGRDTYVIRHRTVTNNQKRFHDFPTEYLRDEKVYKYETPLMN
jgi:hypothetical protein